MALTLLATLTVGNSPLGAANNNPGFEGFTPPGGYTLEVNGSSDAQVVSDGDVLTFTLTDHTYNTCSEGPTTPGCLSNIRWSPWFDRTYVAPFGTGDSWGFTYDIVDPENDCAPNSYTCTVEITSTRNAACTGLPFIGNISPLLISVSGDLGLGFGSSSLPYVISPRLYLDLGEQDCQPYASLSYDSDEFNPLEVRFDATDSYDGDNLDLSDPIDPVAPGAGIVSYSWGFGDGAISFEPDPVHIYNEPGEYEVTVTVTDDEGDIAIAVESIQIMGEVFADFMWSYPDPLDRLTIEFDGTPSYSDAEIFYWEWDFGDGETDSDSPIVTHTYAEEGEVEVALFIEDEFGGFGEVYVTIDVGADPVGVIPTVSSPFGYLYPEGNSGESTSAAIPLELSSPAAVDVFVDWETVDGFGTDAATQGVDYEVASGQVMIPAGETEGTIQVTIIGDDLDEDDELGWIQLTGAAGATIGEDEFGIVFIEDDDAAPTAIPGSQVVTEGDSGSAIANPVVELTGPSAKTITIDYTVFPANGVIDGGAADITPTSGTLTFAPGETTASIPIEVLGDTVPESGFLYGAEWAAYLLSSPTNVELNPGWEMVGFLLIVDDDVAG